MGWLRSAGTAAASRGTCAAKKRRARMMLGENQPGRGPGSLTSARSSSHSRVPQFAVTARLLLLSGSLQLPSQGSFVISSRTSWRVQRGRPGSGEEQPAGSSALQAQGCASPLPGAQGSSVSAAQHSAAAGSGEAFQATDVSLHTPPVSSPHTDCPQPSRRHLGPCGSRQVPRSSQGPGTEETQCHAPLGGSGDTPAPSRSSSTGAHGSSPLSIRDKSSGLDRAQSAQEQDRHQR